MPELAGDLLTLISARAVPGLTLGVTVGGLLGLLGLTRKRTALVVALLLAVTFLGAGWGLAVLAALQLTLAAVASRLTTAAARPDTLDVLGLAGVTSLCAVGSLSGLALAYWLAAGGGAAVGAAVTWTAELTDTASVLKGDRPAAGNQGIGGRGLIATIIVGGSLTLANAVASRDGGRGTGAGCRRCRVGPGTWTAGGTNTPGSTGRSGASSRRVDGAPRCSAALSHPRRGCDCHVTIDSSSLRRSPHEHTEDNCTTGCNDGAPDGDRLLLRQSGPGDRHGLGVGLQLR